MPSRLARRQPGFTLLELLIACAILALLLAVAVPSYQNHVISGKANTAKSDLLALAIALESQRLLTRSYPADASTTSDVKAAAGGRWNPAQAEFDYQYDNLDGDSFKLTAAAQDGSTLKGCTLTLTSNDHSANTASDACRTHW